MITYDDIEKLIAKVKVAYPHTYKSFGASEFEMLIESWHEDLNGYSRELIAEAFKRARRHCSISITTADIIDQIEKMQAAFSPSEQELWADFLKDLQTARYWADRLYYTIEEPNGKTQGENARENLDKHFENMRPEFKRYVGNISCLIDLANYDDEALSFERVRFVKDIGRKVEQVKAQEQYAALEGMVKLKELK